MKIAYEQHPVSSERKAELRAEGYRIVDARFAPPKPIAEVVEESIELPKPKTTRKAK